MINPYEEKGKELAQAYVPFQEFHGIYPPEECLKKGTVFPELFRPYDGWKYGGKKKKMMYAEL